MRHVCPLGKPRRVSRRIRTPRGTLAPVATPYQEGSLRLAIGLLIVIVGLGIAAHRLWWLYRLSQTGQPAPDRLHSQGARVQAEVTEVVGQRKLLKWTLPGWAHAFTFWGFCVPVSYTHLRAHETRH